MLAVAIAGAIFSLRSAKPTVPVEPSVPAKLPPLTPGRLEAVPVGTTFHDLTADVDGSLWWVDPGLTRFDPESGSLRTFTIADDLRFEEHRLIAGARDGGVWIASSGETIRRFDGVAFREVLAGAPSDIAEAPDGTLFGIGRKDRVVRWDGASWIEVPNDGRPYVAAGNLTLDASGALWVTNSRGSAADMGVSRFDGGTWTTWTTSEGLPSDRVYAMDAAPDGDVWLWLGTGFGIARFTDGEWVTYPPPATRMFNASILATDAGMWIVGGAQGGTAERFDGTSWVPVTTDDGLDIAGGEIRFVRARGVTWAATAAGLFRLAGARWQLVLRSTVGPSSWGSVTAVDADQAWITDEDGILWSVEEGIWTLHRETGFPTGVRDLAVADDGTAWAATGWGLARVDGAQWEVVEVGEHVAVALAPDGTPWTAIPDGEDRTRVRPVGSEVLPAPAPLSPSCFGFVVVAPDDVWAASCGVWEIGAGLAHFDGEDWTRGPEVIDRDSARGWLRPGGGSLVATPDGDVWALADGDVWDPAFKIVLRFRGSTWTRWTTGDGLPSGIGTIDVGPDERVFLIADEGLLEFRQDDWHLVREGTFSGLSIAADGTIWLVGDGVFRLQLP